MKKTLGPRVAVKTKNYSLKKFLIDYAQSKGLTVVFGNIWSEQYPNVMIDEEEEVCSCSNNIIDVKWIEVDEWLDYCDNWSLSEKIKFRLNESYIAEIDKANKMVKVDCQSFPFSKIEEIYNAIKS